MLTRQLRGRGDESSADSGFERGDDCLRELWEGAGGKQRRRLTQGRPGLPAERGDAATMNVLRFFMTYPGMAAVW